MPKRKRSISFVDASDPIGTALKITKAGDGLSKALSIEDRDFLPGELVHVVLECEPAGIATKPVKDADGKWVLVYTLEAGRATFVDPDLVADLLDKQDRRLEEAAGIHRLFDENGDPVDPDANGGEPGTPDAAES